MYLSPERPLYFFFLFLTGPSDNKRDRQQADVKFLHRLSQPQKQQRKQPEGARAGDIQASNNQRCERRERPARLQTMTLYVFSLKPQHSSVFAGRRQSALRLLGFLSKQLSR